MTLTIAVLSDIHGNVAALDAVLADIATKRPDRLWVAGDLLLGGPRPAEVVARLQDLERAGAHIVAGNTDVAVTDADYAASFPWLDEVPASQRDAADWARDQLDDAQLDWVRRLPIERRVWSGDTLALLVHASPGSQTAGLPADLDPSTTVERVTRTDARVICCGHTHVADVRELGRKLIVNPGACGFAHDGDPAAGWALVELPEADEPSATLHRTTYDAQSVAEEISSRGLAGDVYRAATVRTGRFVR
jgi:predicted phosphodiesterase